MVSYIQSGLNYLHLPIALTTESTTSQKLTSAIQASDVTTISAIIKSDPAFMNKPLANGDLPLNYVVRENKCDVLGTLLDLGADPTLLDDQGMSAIDYALLTKNEKALSTILYHQAGSQVEATTALLNDPGVWSRGQNTLTQIEKQINNLHAKKPENALFTKILSGDSLDHDDFQKKFPNGESVIHLAVATKNWAQLKLILLDPQAKALLNNKDAKGLTPLHYAAALGRQDMIQALIAHGANIQLANQEGLTPIALLGLNAGKKNPLNIGKMEALVFMTTVAALAIQLVPSAYHSPQSYAASFLAAGILDGLANNMRYLSTFKTWKGAILTTVLQSLAMNILQSSLGFSSAMTIMNTMTVYRYATNIFSGLNSCWRNASLGRGKAIMKAVVGPLTTCKFGYQASIQAIKALKSETVEEYTARIFGKDAQEAVEKMVGCTQLFPGHNSKCANHVLTQFKNCREDSQSEACREAGDAYDTYAERAREYINSKYDPKSFERTSYLLTCMFDLESNECITTENRYKNAKDNKYDYKKHYYDYKKNYGYDSGYKKDYSSDTYFEDPCKKAFEVLGCEKTLKDCRTKFYELSKKNHPDKGGDEATFVKISNAWEQAQSCF